MKSEARDGVSTGGPKQRKLVIHSRGTCDKTTLAWGSVPCRMQVIGEVTHLE
jgi:hypothetical protein